MNPHDEVTVTNRDGSTDRGTLLDVLPVRADRHVVNPTGEGEPATLYGYWNGECNPGARVALVAIPPIEEDIKELPQDHQCYAYPEDVVEVVR